MASKQEVVPAGKLPGKPNAEVDLIMGDTMPEIEDSDQAQRAIVAQILSADSMEQVFAEHSTTATKEMVGRPLKVLDGRLMQGNIDGKDSVYMILDVIALDTGEQLALNSGAPKIMAIVYRLKQMGKLPVEAEVVEAGVARPGRNAPLGLRAIGETAAAVAA